MIDLRLFIPDDPAKKAALAKALKSKSGRRISVPARDGSLFVISERDKDNLVSMLETKPAGKPEPEPAKEEPKETTPQPQPKPVKKSSKKSPRK